MRKTPLRSPSEYYRQVDRPSLSFGTAVVLVEATLVAVVVWVFVQRVMAQIDLTAAERADVSGMIVGGAVGVFVAVLLGWLLFGAILHVFVWFAGGDRGFGTTLAVVGEADLVSILLFPVAAVGLFTMVGDVPSDPAAAASFLERAGPYSSPIAMLSSFVGFVWRAVIQGIGLAEAHDLPVGKMLTLTFVLGFLGFVLNLA